MAIPAPSAPHTLASLETIMCNLRNPINGCPWDQQQTFETIAPYTIEEAYEVADAIANSDLPALKEELGDLLLQVVYHARLAEEQGAFSLCDVIDGICAKMIRRHPHVYDSSDAQSIDQLGMQWEHMKDQERSSNGATSALDGVAISLPALIRAEKLQRRASRVGFDWPDASGPRAKIDEELLECEAALADPGVLAEEIGDLLFSVVNWSRHLGIPPEAALNACNHRFIKRFSKVESMAGEAGIDSMSASELDALWEQAKLAG